jgi:dynein heavy chain
MVEAKEDVNKMKAELAIKNQELAAASKEAEALLKSISESTAIAEKGEERCSLLAAAVHLLASSRLNACSPPGTGNASAQTH